MAELGSKEIAMAELGFKEVAWQSWDQKR